ncbi:polysaccharide deacetylase family protein [Candidatus Woesearchaeota archaeon]|nr:polysaccharide deacetylase family protein [Candidatus Woesearchaeota archaeon]
MVSVCFYFQLHQPYRLRNYQVFEIGNSNHYYDNEKNLGILNKIKNKCYTPTNKLILDLIYKTNGELKVSYSITGILLEQLSNNAPEVIQSFQDLAKTGCVEFLSETYHHTLAYLYSKKEFKKQIFMHKKLIRKLFHKNPRVFRNTELIYNNEIASYIESLGYKGILAEGADHILQWRSPNFVYKPVNCNNIKLLLKNYRLSDDIAFRFSSKSWLEYPLTAPKFAQWINAINGNGNIVNLFMDYETFGEHQWADTGIFNFLEHLPSEILKNPHNNFITPSKAIRQYNAVSDLDIHSIISWADIERDLSAWLGNDMQKFALSKLYALEKQVKKTKDRAILEDWRKLQASDLFYYMCTKWFNDGDVHKYFNPYNSPHEAFIAFMNILEDLNLRTKTKKEVIVI